jgi:acyl-CoA hydrolase
MPSVVDTYIENREMVQPNHANMLETAHGGHVLKWMDEIGAMSAMRFAGASCVTAHINQVDFERPVQVGDIALIKAYVYEAGRSSIKVRLQAFREDLRTGEAEKTTESYFVYVAIDEDRTPIPVPELTIGSERGERLREEARSGERVRQ